MPRPTNKERNQKIARKYIEGATLRELGALFNLSAPSILNALKKEGVPRRSPYLMGKTKADEQEKRNKEIFERYEETWGSLDELAAVFNLDRLTIKKALVSQGVDENDLVVVRTNPKGFDQQKLDWKILEKYNRDGFNIEMLADFFGILPKQVRASLSRSGILEK